MNKRREEKGLKVWKRQQIYKFRSKRDERGRTLLVSLEVNERREEGTLVLGKITNKKL